MERVAGGPPTPATAGLVLLCAKDLDAAPHAFPLRDSSVVIGREPPRGGCPVRLSSVSRAHAELVRDPSGAWLIRDLESRNGTYVDGQRVTQRTFLRPHAEIRIGDALFKLVMDGIEEYRGYRLDGRIADAFEPRDTFDIIGGVAMDRVRAQIERVARSDLGVLVLGETGTGKELVARAIHRVSGRPGPFLAVNCAAVPAQLFESELFGYRRGAFSGADRDKPGILQAAGAGTVLLDEIGDMPLELQPKLLRAIEAREILPIGAVRPEHVDARFVFATHQDVERLVDAGKFRSDLYARMNTLSVALPPLRARKEDVYQLVAHFLRQRGRPDLRPDFTFMFGMCDYDWPRNVRECAAVVARAIATSDGTTLGAGDLPAEIRAHLETYGARVTASSDSVPEAPASMPAPETLMDLLARHQGNVAAVARELDKDRAQVHRMMRRHALVPDDYRPDAVRRSRGREP